MRSWLVVMLSVALLVVGCGENEDDPRKDGGPGDDGPGKQLDGGLSDAPPPGCGIAPSGSPGSAGLAVGAVETLDSRDADAQSNGDHDRNGQLADAALGALRVSPCGDVGLVMRLASANSAELVYVDPTAASPKSEQIDAKGHKNFHDASLFFDGACSPLVLRGTRSTGYVEYSRAAGVWTAKTVKADFSAELGGAPTSLSHVAADVGADGKLYVFAKAEAGGKRWLLRGSRAASAGASWSFEALPAPEATQLYVLRVDKNGTTHALYRNTAYPCDPCNVDLRHGSLAKGATSWSEEIVQKGKWGDPDDAFVEAADMAFATDGSPIIVGHFTTRVVTGSYKSAELRLYGKVSGKWCSDGVAKSVDLSYVGGDGAGFTGADPQLRMDSAGRLHVLFRDQSLWHDKTGENEMRGQLRYALRVGDAWTLKTLVSQQGQVASNNPLMGMGQPLMAISSDGKKLVAAGVEVSWQTDSIYNQQAKPASYSAKALQVDLTVD